MLSQYTGSAFAVSQPSTGPEPNSDDGSSTAVWAFEWHSQRNEGQSFKDQHFSASHWDSRAQPEHDALKGFPEMNRLCPAVLISLLLENWRSRADSTQLIAVPIRASMMTG